MLENHKVYQEITKMKNALNYTREQNVEWGYSPNPFNLQVNLIASYEWFSFPLVLTIVERYRTTWQNTMVRSAIKWKYQDIVSNFR